MTRVTLGLASASVAADPARAAAMKALEFDPDLADGHQAMGNVLATLDWKWAAAEDELKRAIALDPNFPDSLNDYSFFLLIQGRLSEALTTIERAVALDPFGSGMHLTNGLVQQALGRYNEAAQQFRTSVELDPANQSVCRCY
jgi:Tfp pilus assembly protein PilF